MLILRLDLNNVVKNKVIIVRRAPYPIKRHLIPSHLLSSSVLWSRISTNRILISLLVRTGKIIGKITSWMSFKKFYF